jgi:thiosulfate/3-mercaptopyruvate sulfurtransferase
MMRFPSPHSKVSMRTAILLALGLSLSAGAVAAQAARDALVVPSSWLAAHLNDANLVVLQVGDRAEYDKGHIPGARFVTLNEVAVSDPAGLTLEMIPADKLRDKLVELGISTDSRIVVAYDRDRVSSATRLIFTLDYAGLGARTSMLDGGLTAWTREGRELTAAVTPPRTGTLAALTTRPMIVTSDYVQAHLGKAGTSVVDGRTTAFYSGTQTGGGRGGQHKTGHIAGAKSVPFNELTDAQLLFKSADALRALFIAAGIAPGDTVVGYCHIGQQATAMLFAARTLGHPVLLYDGSFEDWSKKDLPVAKTP